LISTSVSELPKKRVVLMVKSKIKNPDLIRKRQQQICGGAMKVFRKKGFHAASIRQIARASRMSLGSLYDYIEKKEDILFLVHKDILDQIYLRIDSISRQYTNPLDQLINVLKGLFDLTCERKEEMLFVYTETKSLEKWYLHEILRKEAAFVDRFRELIESGVREGTFQCENPDLIANILIFCGSFIPLRGWNVLHRYSEPEVFEVLKAMMLKTLNVKSTGGYA